MKRFLFLCCLLLTISLNACQCSNKPDVGPVDNDDDASITLQG